MQLNEYYRKTRTKKWMYAANEEGSLRREAASSLYMLDNQSHEANTSELNGS